MHESTGPGSRGQQTAPSRAEATHGKGKGPATVRLVHVVHVGLEVQEVHPEPARRDPREVQVNMNFN